ncbi:DNA-cytosine methyltransferase [Cyanobacterium stanieri PCC 7202]|uniref:Cytosine-specific methyltransferase n=1 Tax=Cyanobacterium stanieri (strain ATCC 29140 / PCC 7202) TaxID=292563 RepID=K9YL91_CYASC|nr:DNA-cytosine methyltransferase [Cyanobacterium stanieri PCC 7202]
MNSKKRVLSLFSGCGGMDLGMEGNFWVHEDFINKKIHPDWVIDKNKHLIKLAKTSFETVFSNDIEVSAKNAWLSYFNRNIFHQESVVDLVEKHNRGEFSFPKDIDIVTGGFPCQDFSVAGKRRGLQSHKNHDGNYLDKKTDNYLKNRGMLYYWMKKVIEITQPKIFIAENVKGLNSLFEVKKKIESDFQAINNQGYIVFSKLLYAPDYGIPQTRERLFFIGINKQYLSRKWIKLSNLQDFINPFPEITHYDPQNSVIHNNNLKSYSTVRSALSGLLEPELEINDQAQMKFSRAKFYGKTQGQIEINLDGLSPTIRAEHHGNIEFRRLSLELGGRYHDEINSGKKMRRLTVRECARIQTFPDDYEFVRDNKIFKTDLPISASKAYKLIGNAVPPLLSYHIAMKLDSIWDNLFNDNYLDHLEQQRSAIF